MRAFCAAVPAASAEEAAQDHVALLLRLAEEVRKRWDALEPA